MRTLEWIKNLGDVELEIELDDGKKTFNVTPAQATVILKFQEKGITFSSSVNAVKPLQSGQR